MLKSEYRGIVLEIINKSILLHAPFLKSNSNSNIDLILKGWNEYFNMYLSKKNIDISKQEAKLALKNLDEKNYIKFKEIQSKYKKKTV